MTEGERDDEPDPAGRPENQHGDSTPTPGSTEPGVSADAANSVDPGTQTGSDDGDDAVTSLAVRHPIDSVDLLIVEDDHHEARYVERLLHEHALANMDGRSNRFEIDRIRHVDRFGAALDALADDPADVVLLDLMLPDSRGVDTVARLAAHHPELPIVVMTGEDRERTGVTAIQQGAQDYLVKGTFSGELVHRTIRYAIERKRHEREFVDANQKLALLNEIIRGDIRNEMSVALGWVDVLDERIDQEDRAAFEAMRTAAQNVVELTDTAADVASALDTTVGTYRHPSSLESILDEGLQGFLDGHPNTVHAIDYRKPEDGPVTVLATPMFATAFAHLLSNVVDLDVVNSDVVNSTVVDSNLASDDADDSTAVSITVDVTDDTALVHVRGDGVELTADQRASLHDADRRSAEHVGLNTGLYLVTTLLEQLGGTIDVSDDADGTTVTITLDRVATVD